MILCIAEKPSVGREIAKVLGADTRHEGYMEGNGYYISWTFGHLCTLQEPHDYSPDWKTWRMEFLPMIPPKFRLKLSRDKGAQKQFEVLAKLITLSTEVINCGDAGQEGELIQRWVLQKAGCKLQVKRLWISSLTQEAIRKGFENLQPASKYDNLYAAGSARAIGDWLLGMNATRAYTLKYGKDKQVLSIGRVQTPTLAILVERQKAIDNFVPQAYWELKTNYRGGVFNSTKGKFTSLEKAQQIFDLIKDKELKITKVDRKKAKELAPRLFDLTSLQVECNKKFGFSAEHGLSLAQSLYEKKLTSYPRVDTTYLPSDVFPRVGEILKNLVPYANYTQKILGKAFRKSTKVFDDKKITDHHAIIPTGEFAAAASLSQDEKYMFDLIIRRFIAVFYPDCEFAQTTVMAQVESYDFKATGKEILVEGWRELFPTAAQKKSNNEEGPGEEGEKESKLLPIYQVGEQGAHQLEILQKQTQPPKTMSEGDLLRAMETAGKTVEDEELMELMKANGIGRPSTRANIIETLIKRDYVRKEKKKLIPSPIGMNLIDTIPNALLKSPELTGQWEKKLSMINDGKYEIQSFMAELKQMLEELLAQVRNSGN